MKYSPLLETPPRLYKRASPHFHVLLIAIALGTATTARAAVIYNSIPSPLPPNVSSLGPEAYGFSQLGDGVVFTAGSPRVLNTVKVILSDWACQHGSWTVPAGSPGACVTTPGTTFAQPITLNIYAVAPGPSAGALLATTTVTFQIPFRPSSVVGCDDGGRTWRSPVDNNCYHGVAFPITFDLNALHLTLPNQVALGVSYNTSDFGPTPLRPQPCNSDPVTGCPYDSLNISVQGGPLVGSVVDPVGIFVNWTIPNFSCNGTGVFTDDNGQCLNSASDGPPNGWRFLHPEFEVTATLVSPGDAPFSIGYAANLNVGDSVLNLTNSGRQGGFFGNANKLAGNLCANVYVFDPREEMIGCCSCLVTPNGLNALSARNDLISNPLTPVVPNSITIDLLSSFPVTNSSGVQTCNPASLIGGPASGMVAWGSTIEPAPRGTFSVVPVPYVSATLSESELTSLTTSCNFIQSVGSGFGICAACRTGGLGGTKR